MSLCDTQKQCNALPVTVVALFACYLPARRATSA
jgi:hypothetical protein